MRRNQPFTIQRSLNITLFACVALFALLSACRPTGDSKTPRQAKQQPRPSSKPKLRISPLPHAALLTAGIEADKLRCNSAVMWRKEIRPLATRAATELAKKWKLQASEADIHGGMRIVIGYLVRFLYQVAQPQNLGALALRGLGYLEDGKKKPLVIYRSGVMTDAENAASCFQDLLRVGGVRHVVNLYSGHMPFYQFIDKEAAVARRMNASHKNVRARWRELVKRPADFDKNKEAAMKVIGRIINEEILRPGGKAPRGNVYFHCGGGMHRSGMVYGILQRCINGAPKAEVERDYKRHTGYVSAAEKGGFEALNLRFIEEFDCALLQPNASSAVPTSLTSL
jgi:hypothetical protein